MTLTDFRIDVLARYEKYLPVLTEGEIAELMKHHPSLGTLQDWESKLNNHRARMEQVFSSAYQKQKYYGSREKRIDRDNSQ